MKKSLTLFCCTILFITVLCVSSVQAQFSKSVIILKGVVKTDSGKPHSVRVSVRTIGDTAVEITSSISNKNDGRYLVILKSSKKYWIHFENDDIISKDELIETPDSKETTQINKDFNVTVISVVKKD